jgi:molecular chaperone Hsp33
MDYVSHFILEDLDIRGAIVHLGNAWRAMQTGRDYADTTRALLGEMTAVTTLIGSNLKTPGRISFQVRGNGTIKLMVVDCDEQLRLRGVARLADGTSSPAADSISRLIGDGQLVLTLHANSADDKPYQSVVPLEGDTVAAIFENYLALSEQAASRLWLTADAGYACGLFLQKLPNADMKDADGWNRAQVLAGTVTPAELALPAETLLERLFPEENVRLFAAREASYHCPRDEQKVIDMLRSLGEAELTAIIAERGEILIHDEICNHEYRFGKELLPQLFPPEQRTLH